MAHSQSYPSWIMWRKIVCSSVYACVCVWHCSFCNCSLFSVRSKFLIKNCVQKIAVRTLNLVGTAQNEMLGECIAHKNHSRCIRQFFYFTTMHSAEWEVSDGFHFINKYVLVAQECFCVNNYFRMFQLSFALFSAQITI